MKIAALLLFLPGLVCLGQAIPPGQSPPERPMPPKWQFRLPETPPYWQRQPGNPAHPMIVPVPGSDLDTGIVHRPPPFSFTRHPPRTPLAHDLYPDLKVLPIETARLEPIPTTWPGFELERIPTMWPNLKGVPVEGEPSGNIFPAAGEVPGTPK